MGVYAQWSWYCDGCDEMSEIEFDWVEDAEDSWKRHLHEDHERTDDPFT